jgi:hypothetical protein
VGSAKGCGKSSQTQGVISKRRRPSSAIRWAALWPARVTRSWRNGWYCWAVRKTGDCLLSCMLRSAKRFESSALGRPPAVSEGTMKKPRNRGKASKPADADEILPEYDFSRARRSPYASRYTSGSVVVVLEPDVAAAFPGSAEANQALRALAGIIEKHRSRAPVPRRRS